MPLESSTDCGANQGGGLARHSEIADGALINAAREGQTRSNTKGGACDRAADPLDIKT